MSRRSAHVLLALVVLAALVPWHAVAQTPAATEPPRVVATFSILGDLVQRVAGDEVAVTTLIGPGVDAHTYDPAPADLVVLEQADLIVENGLGFEPWLDRFLESAGSPAIRLVASEGITPRSMAEGADEAGHEGEAEDDQGGVDPHVWHDVANVIVMTENIRDGLIAVDPARAATYEANAAAFIAELRDLDAWVREQVETIPADRRKLVTSHDTFGYFADAYGLEIVGTALGSLSTEAGDPSAQQIAMLIEDIRAAGMPAIFAENVANPDLMESIAAEAGVTLAPPLYTDALGPPGSPGVTYEGMIRANVSTIVDALAG